jgi:hypothetical protein
MRFTEIYSEICVGKHLSPTIPIQNCLKQGHALSAWLFNFPSEYAIRKFRENQVGLKLNGTHQVLVYTGNENLFGDNVNTTRKTQKL